MVVSFVNLKGFPSLILGDPLIGFVLTILSIMHCVSPQPPTTCVYLYFNLVSKEFI